jgi:hypothetical protein
MRVVVATIVGLAASSTQTAPGPSKAYSSARLHETPAEKEPAVRPPPQHQSRISGLPHTEGVRPDRQ